MNISGRVSNGDIYCVATIALYRKFLLASGAATAVYSNFRIKTYSTNVVVWGRAGSAIEVIGSGAYSASWDVVRVVEAIDSERLVAHHTRCWGGSQSRFC